MNSAELAPLGRTKLKLTRLGFGGAPVGNLYRAMSDEDSRATIDAAWDVGVRYYDTAPWYGLGLSERRIGDALRRRPRDSFVLSTKIGRWLKPGAMKDPPFVDPLPFRPKYDYTYDGVMRSVDQSFQRLGLSRIDILYVHDLAPHNHPDPEILKKYNDELWDGGGYKALLQLRDEKAVGAIGAGIGDWHVCEGLARKGDFDVFMPAGRYTLLEQECLTSFLPLCESRNIAIVIGGPYNSGILATGAKAGANYNYRPASEPILARVRAIEEVAREFGVSLIAAALQFPLHHPAVVSVIPGAGSAAEVHAAAKTMREPIPAAFYVALKAKGLIAQNAPIEA